MTFSIVACCPDTQQLGVAAATGTAGVGKLLAWASPRVGAVATQGWINPYIGVDGLDLLQHGHPTARVLDAVLALDPAAQQRQVGMVDANGDAQAWTGQDCEGWAGHRVADGFTVQGNLLESSRTVESCAEHFAASSGALVDRLMLALRAGAEAGGDRRGERSAAVLVMDEEEYPLWDVRVDCSDDPIPELFKMQEILAEELVEQVRKMPTRRAPGGQLSTSSHDGLV